MEVEEEEKKKVVKVEKDAQITPETLVNEDFLRKIGVREPYISEALDKLNQAEIRRVSTLLRMTEDRLINIVKLSIGTVGVLRKFIDAHKQQQQQSILPRDTQTIMEAMSTFLSTVKFPTDTAAYEFNILKLPETNPYATRVKEQKIVEDWNRPGCPNFLLTNLEERVVKLSEFRWNRTRRCLSRVSDHDEIDLGSEFGCNSYALVSASGSGKTRYLFEECNQNFGIYLVTHLVQNQPGLPHLWDFLKGLPAHLPEDDARENVRGKLFERMSRAILAHIAVLKHVLKVTPNLKPRHWLALQLFPGRFSGGKDVFTEALIAGAKSSVSCYLLPLEWSRFKHVLRFIAIDEAQFADKLYKNTFENFGSVNKRSALSVLVSVISSLPTNIILSGTGLGIESSIELLTSSAAKNYATARLFGITTFFDERDVLTAINSRGFNGNIDDDPLQLYTGRPRFAMRLAEALLLGKSLHETAKDIVGGFENKLGELKQISAGTSTEGSKMLYSELRFVAMEWMLRGKGGIQRNGDIALELGVCALSNRVEDEDASLFVIREPLLVRAFTNSPSADFESITNESAQEIGYMFEDYIALNARHLLDGILTIAKDQISKLPKFQGPWKFAVPAGDELVGIGSRDGDEPKHIQRILDCAGGKGPCMVFPATSLGADVIVAVKHQTSERKLLVFIQVKACMKVSSTTAMNSLKYPYHQNRDTTPKVPDNKKAAFEEFNQVIQDASIMRVVIKYPADSRKRLKRVNVEEEILNVVFDKSNAEAHLDPLSPGLKAMMSVKALSKFKHLFLDE